MKRLRALLRLPETPLFLVLTAFAAISSLRLDDDSFQHFARSVDQVRRLALGTWITDVWNKPLTGLVYGVAGLLGWFPARLVSVVCVVGTVHLSVRLCEHLLPEQHRPGRGLLVWLFAAQFAVMKDAFVTMTELPAAFLLTWSVWLHLVRGRTQLATFVAGLAPLCRVELVPVVAFFTLFVAAEAWKNGERSWPRLLAIVVPSGVPFLGWLVAGTLATQDVAWFSRASYAHLRTEWGPPGVFQHNVFAGLANVASPPLLLAFFYGIGVCSRRAFAVVVTPRGAQRPLALLLGILAVHYLLLNTLVVFPDDWYGAAFGQAVAALNARNYSPTAGILTVVACLGLREWLQAASPAQVPRSERALVVCSVLVALALAAAKLPKASAELGLCLTLLVAATFGARRLRSAAVGPSWRAWRWAVGACALAALVIRPFFWYPTWANDRRGNAVYELAALVETKRPRRVVQDIAAALELGQELQGLDCKWSWPGDFPGRLADAPTDSLLIVETDPHGAPLSRYPASVAALVQDASRARLAATFRTPPPPRWLDAIDRLSARNPSVAWSAYWVGDAGDGAQK